ncbi:NADP-dependent isocitrate dehydrogenase [Campylobacter canadensis]|uniref:NADP-dependent isocitrate dehydrogenase n=1 Tax=Campylobacter canadensis TaxID=449520 RepID=UPI0015572179|nr:NADP-dependent isocitrate dehydrogenase [Campylobacter canadensis]MBZ7994878.1 NADP-dependent isocitrate dehydrogenase [Campylobacter canadensis]MBZ7996735.1 NADP-dependent isocitrate dehydrogenase [Campylobacter canadensis]MBZ8000295.1 NADP-dependent isocitrate dehydrogenase [Campylobacter canadensis]MBZ8002032.1 NADP-dependent isocitrate dehydrogenase [Campylobacter canadensis]MBZ8004028.1 NADP-dependent isocitrate dehydrogenase [Campylobacter canadensis]
MGIIYTFTDESPALATLSFLPIAQAFLSKANIKIDVSDISLAARILAAQNSYLKEEQKVEDALAKLGELVKKDGTNLIKTPNISASIPQLKAAIKELQEKGFNVPNYPDNPSNAEEEQIKENYAKVLGSAVNPVLRQGNSDRRSTNAVKEYAKANPYKVKEFSKDSKTRVSYMNDGDFFDNEKAVLIPNDGTIKLYEVVNQEKNELKSFAVSKDEILDATFMNVEKLDKFYDEQIKICKEEDILFSLHLKATMMKISDPVLFAHALKVFFKELFTEFKDEFEKLQINPNNGLSELLSKIENSNKKDEILKKYNEILEKTPISMVNSDKGITNLHVPSDVIVDASMPAMLKNGAKLWDKEGKEKDTNAVIPDKTYATIYEAVIDDLRQNGTLNPSKIGSVSNVGLMAKKAQEYGSHDKTFIANKDANYVIELDGKEIMRHEVKKGDIYRINLAKMDAIKNWIKLAEQRFEQSKEEVIFWLDEKRPSNKIMIDIIKAELANKFKILKPYDACKESLRIIRSGKNCISATGNVLRDYLTDLFPILELGTSAKMLSIVPMLNGGAMFETGAGGSAPKQVEQVIEENHLRWDSLGEFLALQSSLEYEYIHNKNQKANVLAQAFDEAISNYLEENKAPSRKAKENDNRTSHFYFALYLANALAKQNQDMQLQSFFKEVADKLNKNVDTIFNEFMQEEGKKVDLGGYYVLGQKAQEIMRPSKTLNDIINFIKESK